MVVKGSLGQNDFAKFLHSMFSKEAVTCPNCGGEHVAKVLSLIGATSSGPSGGASAAAACSPVAEASADSQAVRLDQRPTRAVSGILGAALYFYLEAAAW